MAGFGLRKGGKQGRKHRERGSGDVGNSTAVDRRPSAAISTTSTPESSTRSQALHNEPGTEYASTAPDMNKSSRSTGTSATPITRNISSLDDEKLGNYYNIDDIEKQDREKAKYIQKEQRIRLEQLEKENNTYLPKSSPFKLQRIYSIDMQTSTETDGSFDQKEWTPQDSSYGAAFPFCGWIPKRKRELIEKILVGFVLFCVIYVVISTAIKLTSSSRKSGDQTINLDDDFYVSDMQNDDYYGKNLDDDDLFDDGSSRYYRKYYKKYYNNKYKYYGGRR